MSPTDYDHYSAWKGWRDRPFGICPSDQAVYFSAELRRCGIEAIAGKTILEIGFGNGAFAAWARNAGAEYHGTELIAELVARATTAGLNAYDGRRPLDTLLGPNTIDVIVAFDVLEHLDAEALLATLRSAHRALRAPGRLIVRVPSGDSPFARSIQHGDATHRLAIGSSMVRQLADDAGFNLESVRAPVFPLSGLGLRVFLRRSMVTIARAVTYAVISRALMGGGEPVLTPNMVFVLVKP